jgi:hypothetical protein
MTITWVLVLVYYLKGGLLLTQSIEAKSQLDCQKAGELIKQHNPSDLEIVDLNGKTHKLTITSIDSQCVRFPLDSSV